MELLTARLIGPPNEDRPVFLAIQLGDGELVVREIEGDQQRISRAKFELQMVIVQEFICAFQRRRWRREPRR
jgi:hypothetical protein